MSIKAYILLLAETLRLLFYNTLGACWCNPYIESTDSPIKTDETQAMSYTSGCVDGVLPTDTTEDRVNPSNQK